MKICQQQVAMAGALAARSDREQMEEQRGSRARPRLPGTAAWQANVYARSEGWLRTSSLQVLQSEKAGELVKQAV